MTCDVLIITGKDARLGGGHFQRMAALAWRLANKFQLRVRMIINPREGDAPDELSTLITDEIASASLIVRDMRDSSEKEIIALKKYGKVCVIDDRGKGRTEADYRIDILPHFERKDDAVRGHFLYGYNYIKNLEALKGEIVPKSCDVVLYGGFAGDSGTLLRSIIPDNCSYYILGHRGVIAGTKGIGEEQTSINYARALCASKAALSHFGIFLYEAHAALCRVAAAHPTDYHSAVCESARDELELVNLGVHGSFDVEAAKHAVSALIRKPLCDNVNSAQIMEKALSSVDRFAESLLSLL